MTTPRTWLRTADDGVLCADAVRYIGIREHGDGWALWAKAPGVMAFDTRLAGHHPNRHAAAQALDQLLDAIDGPNLEEDSTP